MLLSVFCSVCVRRKIIIIIIIMLKETGAVAVLTSCTLSLHIYIYIGVNVFTGDMPSWPKITQSSHPVCVGQLNRPISSLRPLATVFHNPFPLLVFRVPHNIFARVIKYSLLGADRRINIPVHWSTGQCADNIQHCNNSDPRGQHMYVPSRWGRSSPLPRRSSPSAEAPPLWLM